MVVLEALSGAPIPEFAQAADSACVTSSGWVKVTGIDDQRLGLILEVTPPRPG